MKKLIGLAAAFVCLQSGAANWKYISSSDADPMTSKTIVEVDAGTVRLRDGARQAWSRYSYQPPVAAAQGIGKTIGTALMLQTYDCKNEESGILQYTEYSARFSEGEAGYSSSVPRNAVRLTANIPGSFGEAVLKYVCAYPLK